MTRHGSGKPAKGVRPTTAKVAESLLAILAPELPGARAVDLFAGTGQIGLGFFCGGAESVLFVEGNPGVARALRARLLGEKKDARWSVCRSPLPQALGLLEGPYDLFWADPPYDWNEAEILLCGLAPHAAPGAILAVEHHHKTPYLPIAGWELYREKKFGETRLSFFRFTPS